MRTVGCAAGFGSASFLPRGTTQGENRASEQHEPAAIPTSIETTRIALFVG